MPSSSLLRFTLIGLVALCGCQDANLGDPGGGRPIGQEDDVPDAAPPDAYESPRRDGDVVFDADLTDAPAPIDIDGGSGGLDEAACNACEELSCRDVDDLDLYAACFLAMDPAMAGPGAGMPKSKLCQDVLHCARVTGCSAVDPQPCYCGEGVSDILCLAGQAVGPCKAEIEIAAESSSSALIAERLADPSYALGAAFNLLRYCEVPICSAECSGGGGDLPDAGPPPPPADAAPIAFPDAAPVLIPDAAPIVTTLLANPGFDDGVASWTAEFGASQSWDAAHDGQSVASSGSIAVDNTIVISTPGTTMTGASQCVAATAGATYQLAAQVLISPGQGAGTAGLNVQFFPAASCAGALNGAWASEVTGVTGAWTSVSGALTVPAGAQSMRVRLVAVKTFAAPAFQAHFDNVVLETP